MCTVCTHAFCVCMPVWVVRPVQVEGVLGHWSQVLRSIAFLLPEDLNSLVHREAQVGRGWAGGTGRTLHCLCVSVCVSVCTV